MIFYIICSFHLSGSTVFFLVCLWTRIKLSALAGFAYLSCHRRYFSRASDKIDKFNYDNAKKKLNDHACCLAIGHLTVFHYRMEIFLKSLSKLSCKSDNILEQFVVKIYRSCNSRSIMHNSINCSVFFEIVGKYQSYCTEKIKIHAF